MEQVKFNPAGKIAAIYMRVSTANQEQEQTIKGQLLELEERTKKDSVILPDRNIYKDEGWSGALIERPELDRLRTDAKLKKFEVLYVYDKGRLSRNFLHQELVLEEFRKLNIKVIELHGGVEGESSEALMFGQMMGVFQQYERVKIAERMRLGKRRIVEKDKELLGYIPNFGYDLNKTIKTGPNKRRAFFSVNEEQAKIVKHIYELCASGMSLYAIRNQLVNEGISTPKGGKKWGNNTLRRLLTNETYIGKHYYNKLEAVESDRRYKTNGYKRVVKNSRRERPKEEWLPIEVEPIISKDLFLKVQKQLEKNKKYNPRNSKNKYLLTGLVHCSCGRARTGDPGGKESTYYRCTDRLNHQGRECYLHGINSVILDDLVWNHITRLLIDPVLLSKYAQKWATSKDDYIKEKAEIAEQINNLNQKRARFIEAYGDGILDQNSFKEKTEEIMLKKRRLEDRLQEIKCQETYRPNIDPNNLSNSVVKLLLENGLTFEDKRAIVRELVIDVIADPKEVTIIGRIPITESGEVVINSPYQNYWNEVKKLENEQNKTDLTDKEIGYKLKNRNRWITKCRKEYAF